MKKILQERRRWYTSTKIPDDTLIALSDTGYSNDDISLGWLAHFGRFTSRRKTGAYRLLLLDGYGSHCTKQFIDYCDRYNPFCFPPHTTHLLQPLDVVVFQPYKHYHTEELSKRHEPAALISTKSNSCTHFVLSESRPSKKTPSSLHSGKPDCYPSPPKSFLSNYAKHRHLRVRVHPRPSEVPARVPRTHHSLSGL